MINKEYTSVVKLEFGCNNFEASSKKEFNLYLQNKEITEIMREGP